MTRPQPVVDAAGTASTVIGVVGTLLTIGVTLGLLSADDAATLTAALTGVTTAALTIVGVVLPLIQARRAAKLVTPLSSPQDNAGRTLVPVTQQNWTPEQIRTWGDA